jgi:hypothetical protein
VFVKSTVKRNELGRASSLAKAAIKTAFQNEGQPLVTGAVQGTPIDTGALRESGRFEIVGETLLIKFGNSEEGGEVDYAGFVHDGTIRMQGRPFLVNSVSRDKDRIVAALVSEIDKALAR